MAGNANWTSIPDLSSSTAVITEARKDYIKDLVKMTEAQAYAETIEDSYIYEFEDLPNWATGDPVAEVILGSSLNYIMTLNFTYNRTGEDEWGFAIGNAFRMRFFDSSGELGSALDPDSIDSRGGLLPPLLWQAKMSILNGNIDEALSFLASYDAINSMLAIEQKIEDS